MCNTLYLSEMSQITLREIRLLLASASVEILLEGSRVNRSTAVALTMAGAVAAVVLTAPSAIAATGIVRGSVMCESGRAVVGVSIVSTAGGAGIATITALPGHPNTAYFSKTVTFSQAKSSIKVKVGCGGTAASWASTSMSPAKTIKGSYVYNVWCADRVTGLGKCKPATLPGGSATNPFDGGWCTWGAAEMWNRATGSYPSWYGNAVAWKANAQAQGFKIATYPRERALAVFDDGGSVGHVAWVTKVWVSGSTTMFHIVEMNYGELWKWNERDVAFGAGMSFIVAPPGAPVLTHP